MMMMMSSSNPCMKSH